MGLVGLPIAKVLNAQLVQKCQNFQKIQSLAKCENPLFVFLVKLFTRESQIQNALCSRSYLAFITTYCFIWYLQKKRDEFSNNKTNTFRSMNKFSAEVILIHSRNAQNAKLKLATVEAKAYPQIPFHQFHNENYPITGAGYISWKTSQKSKKW